MIKNSIIKYLESKMGYSDDEYKILHFWKSNGGIFNIVLIADDILFFVTIFHQISDLEFEGNLSFRLDNQLELKNVTNNTM